MHHALRLRLQGLAAKDWSDDLQAELNSSNIGGNVQFKSPHRGVSTIDLLEAMAVTEGFRATVKEEDNNALRFREFIDKYYPNPDSEYRRVIDIVSERFGTKVGYELTPRVSYLALNGDQPARNFWTYVNQLSSDRSDIAYALTATEIIDLFGMDIQQSLIALSSDGLPKEGRHPIFEPYMNALAHMGSVERRYEFAARPGSWFRDTDSADVLKLMPPFIVCRGAVSSVARFCGSLRGDEAVASELSAVGRQTG